MALLGAMGRRTALSTGLLTAVGVAAFLLVFPNLPEGTTPIMVGGSVVGLLMHAAILGSLVDRGCSRPYPWMFGAILAANTSFVVFAIVVFLITFGTREAPGVLGMLAVAGIGSAMLSAALTTLVWRLVEQKRL